VRCRLRWIPTPRGAACMGNPTHCARARSPNLFHLRVTPFLMRQNQKSDLHKGILGARLERTIRVHQRLSQESRLFYRRLRYRNDGRNNG